MALEPQLARLDTNGITLQVAQAGRIDGPLVILLHGFPEFWYGWHHQIGPLAEAGFRVLAPDQRGYNGSDKPKDVAAYQLDTLASDVVGLIDVSGRDRAMLVGHDWGGIVAWWTALRSPDRLERLAILNAPHPIAMRRQMRRSLAQRLKSWYILAFQLPWLPETLLGQSRGKRLARTMRRTARPGTFSDEEMERYRESWSRPGALTTMIHWYRAALRARPEPTADPRIKVPTLLVWGARDRFMTRRLAPISLDLCDQGRLVIFEEATHWIAHEEPARVNRLLIDFLRGANDLRDESPEAP